MYKKTPEAMTALIILTTNRQTVSHVPEMLSDKRHSWNKREKKNAWRCPTKPKNLTKKAAEAVF